MRRILLRAIGLLLQVVAVLVAVRAAGSVGDLGALELLVLVMLTAALAVSGYHLQTRNAPLTAT